MKLHVIVRKDLEWPHRAVQGGHAVEEYHAKTPITSRKTGTLVYLGVENEKELRKLKELLDSEYGMHTVAFHEPFWQNSMTAFAVEGKDNPLIALLQLL